MTSARYQYLIIGGGIAGIAAAETLREISPSATIGVVSDEDHALYSRVLIPSYLKGRIKREQLFLRSPQDFTEKNIDLRLSQAVVSVDTRQKVVSLDNGRTVGYAKLLISSGGRVKEWGFGENIESRVYRMQTIGDADKLMQDFSGLVHPLVIGSSFIALEFLEVFFLRHIAPTLLVRDSRFMGKLFEDQGAELMQRNFERHGVLLSLGDEVRFLSREKEGILVTTKEMRQISCDGITLGIGIDRRLEFLKDSGLTVGSFGVKTNEFLETDVPGVYAAGDVAEYFDVIQGRPRVSGNWTSAFLQGKRAGFNMGGIREPFRHVSSYSITNLGYQITVLGDTVGKAEDIVSVDETKDGYRRFFLRDGVLVGAVLLNRFQDKPHLTKLIEQKFSLDSFKDKLTDPEFDVRSIG